MLTMGQQLTAEQRISKAIVAITSHRRYIVLAGALMLGKKEVTDKVPTACTDGRDEWYGRTMIDKLSDAELRFVILHENRHKMYRHLTTWKHLWDIDAQCANMACDYVINLEITDENKDNFAVMPKGEYKGLLDEKFRGMSAAQVFDILYQQQGGQNGSSGNGSGDGSGNSSGNGSGARDNSGIGSDQGTGFDSHDWEGAQAMSEEEQKELAREIDGAIRQGALLAGKVGSGDDALNLDDLLAPQVDWREVMRDFVTTTCSGSDYSTYRRPNRRYVSSGLYLPSGISEQVDELVLAIDTSGSIGQRALTAFLSEVQSICDTVHPRLLRILYWGTKVVSEEIYTMDELDTLISSTKPIGGGGTTVECVPAHLVEHGITPQAAIILTDGYLGGSWGSWTCPTLWCILGNKSATADNGVTVHIKSGEM